MDKIILGNEKKLNFKIIEINILRQKLSILEKKMFH